MYSLDGGELSFPNTIRNVRVSLTVWLIPPSKRLGKAKTKLSVLLNIMDHEVSDYESLKEATLKRC
jgi:hypothetical protein